MSHFTYEYRTRHTTRTISCPRDLSGSGKFTFKKTSVQITIRETEFWAREKYGEGKEWKSRGKCVTNVSCPFYSYRNHINSCTNYSNYIPRYSGYVIGCHFNNEICATMNSDMWYYGVNHSM